MARIRTIKPDFFTSEDIVSLSPLARLLYIALWCEADREGRMKWRPGTLKTRYLPADPVDINVPVTELLERRLVVLYGEGLAWIPTFTEHQHVNPREAKSELPTPEAYVAPLPMGRPTPAVRAEVIARDGGKCRRCGSTERIEIDHILPASAGGPSIPENLRLLCKSCNASRPVNGQALLDDMKKDGYDFSTMWATYSLNFTRQHASNLDLHAQVGKEGRERKGMFDASSRVEGQNQWWKTDEGIKAKGEELSLPARPGESYAEWKRRIFSHIAGNGSSAQSPKSCAYCTSTALGSVGGIAYCSAHFHDAQDRKPRPETTANA